MPQQLRRFGVRVSDELVKRLAFAVRVYKYALHDLPQVVTVAGFAVLVKPARQMLQGKSRQIQACCKENLR